MNLTRRSVSGDFLPTKPDTEYPLFVTAPSVWPWPMPAREEPVPAEPVPAEPAEPVPA